MALCSPRPRYFYQQRTQILLHLHVRVVRMSQSMLLVRLICAPIPALNQALMPSHAPNLEPDFVMTIFLVFHLSLCPFVRRVSVQILAFRLYRELHVEAGTKVRPRIICVAARCLERCICGRSHCLDMHAHVTSQLSASLRPSMPT